MRDILIRECDAIAVRRELGLQNKVQELRTQKAKLKIELQRLIAESAEAGVETNMTEELQLLTGTSTGSIQVEAPATGSIQVEDKSEVLEGCLDSATLSKSSKRQYGRTCTGSVDTTEASTSSRLRFGKSGTEGSIDTEVIEIPGSSSLGKEVQDDVHYKLWPEWVDDSASYLKAITTQTELKEYEQTSMEMEWLRKRESSHQMSKEHTQFRKCVSGPNSAFVMYWELSGIPVLFYDLMTIPLQVFYKPKGTVSTLIKWIIILYWTLDLLFRLLFFGFVNSEGAVELRRSRICRHYLRTSFLFDFILVAPDWMTVLVGAPRNVALLRTFRLMRLMRLMRMTKLRRIIRTIHDALDSEYFTVIIDIFFNLIAIVGCCHYIGCFWFWLGNESIDGYPSWVREYELEDSPTAFQYVVSMHWAITQFTPGSSRIQPVNIPESWVSIVVLIFGMVFFSLFISSLTQHRMRLQAITGKMDRESWILRKYLRQYGVSVDLTMRTIRYVDATVAPMMQRVQRKDVLLLTYLSMPLQLEVQAEMFCNTLLVHPFLKVLKKRSETLTSHIFAKTVIEMSLAHTDLLFEVGQVCHEMYFVSRGSLLYLLRGTDKVSEIRKNSWCCEPVLWIPWVHKGTSKAAEECDLISIDTTKMRMAVLEHKERAFVRRVAQAYLNDINQLVDDKVALSDTQVFKEESSQYMRGIHEADDNSPSDVPAIKEENV